MSTLDALLAGIVADPLEETRWLILADWLEENDDPRRAELLRLHRRMIATCCEPDAHQERMEWQGRMVELLAAGVRPCVPQHTLELPGGVPLIGSFIPPGSFLMGGTVCAPEQPVHRVRLTKGYFVGVYPVTQEQWWAVTRNNPTGLDAPRRPVVAVSWGDCQEFCAWLTAHLDGLAVVRLPTEAEWEYACRAATTTEFCFGDAINGLANTFDTASGPGRAGPADVRPALPPNPWGLFDMHGNVWEWCDDSRAPYTRRRRTDPRTTSEGEYAQPHHARRFVEQRGGLLSFCVPELGRPHEPVLEHRRPGLFSPEVSHGLWLRRSATGHLADESR